jgi:hypothetical protein
MDEELSLAEKIALADARLQDLVKERYELEECTEEMRLLGEILTGEGV